MCPRNSPRCVPPKVSRLLTQHKDGTCVASSTLHVALRESGFAPLSDPSSSLTMSLQSVLSTPLLSAAIAVVALLVVYLARLNHLLGQTPDEVKKLSPKRWSAELLRETYQRLDAEPIETSTYAQRIPPKLERRYIVTGGSGKFPLAPPGPSGWPGPAENTVSTSPGLAIESLGSNIDNT